MRQRDDLVLLALIATSVGALAAGCGAGTPPGGDRDGSAPALDAALPPGADGGPASDGGPPRDGGSTPGGDAGTATPIDFCQKSCGVAADCAVPSVALYDASHYACEAGLCRWLGCSAGSAGDGECRAAFSSSAFACRDVGGLRQCVRTCGAPADCATPSAAYDADNYACVAGLCEYRGCNDDAECASTFADARYVCRRAQPPDTGLPLPTAERNCVLGCATASDCSTASAAFDADNYACVETACVYRGCNDDAECAASFSSSAYVCR